MDTPPVSPPAINAPALKPGVPLLVGTTLLVVLNMGLGFLINLGKTGNVSRALGAGVSYFVMPVIVALLFSISPSFRNSRSRTKVVFWVSVVVFLSALGSLGRR